MATKTRTQLATLAMAALVSGGLLAAPITQAQTTAGFITTKNALVKTVAPGVTVKPILSTSDTLSNGYTMAALPDGLGAFDNGDGTFTLYMNHELRQSSTGNLTDSRVSKLKIKKDTLEVMDGKYVVTGAEGYKRFCSATLVGPKEGFDRPYYLTGEEDITGKYGGIAVVIDSKNDVVTQLVYAGRYRWENFIAVPGWKDKTVMMGFDDGTPGGVYMYVGNNPTEIWTGKADMYVFVADNGARTEDKVSKGAPISGKFVKIDKAKASIDNKGNVAEAEAAGYFKFARPEDGTYDLKDPTKVYFDVTGSATYTDTTTGKAYNAKGRTFSMKMDASDPTKVTALSVLLDGNAGDDILSPDNIAASETHLMIQEDINSEFTGVRPGHIVSYELATGKTTVIAELAHRDYAGNPIDKDILGEQETSGIINASSILGKDMWLFDVQAHTLKVPQFSGTDEAGQLLALMVPGSASVQQAEATATVAAPTVAPATATKAPAPPTTAPVVNTPTTAPAVNTPTTQPTVAPPPPTAQPLLPAPVSGDGATPGMPSTGQGASNIWLLLLGISGAGLTMFGLAIRRGKRA